MRRRLRDKFVSWFRRYLPAEIVGTIMAVVGAVWVYDLVPNILVAAFVGTWSENIGYYGTILIGDAYASVQDHKKNRRRYSFSSFGVNVRDIVFEFGPGEVLDFFVVRPFLMYFFPLVTGNLAVGIFLGKVVSDVVFYVPTVVMYEWRKRK